VAQRDLRWRGKAVPWGVITQHYAIALNRGRYTTDVVQHKHDARSVKRAVNDL